MRVSTPVKSLDIYLEVARKLVWLLLNRRRANSIDSCTTYRRDTQRVTKELSAIRNVHERNLEIQEPTSEAKIK